MPNVALLFKSSGSLFHILRNAYEGRYSIEPEFEFNEVKARLKSAENRFQLSVCLNFEILNTI